MLLAGDLLAVAPRDGGGRPVVNAKAGRDGVSHGLARGRQVIPRVEPASADADDQHLHGQGRASVAQESPAGRLTLQADTTRTGEVVLTEVEHGGQVEIEFHDQHGGPARRTRPSVDGLVSDRPAAP